jgi:hypothetical protein
VITYAARVCFSPYHLKLLARTEAYVGLVSDAWGNELRCHELARAVRHVLGDFTLVVVDGRCGPVEHSWIVCEGGVILDVYVPGRLPAIQIIDPIVGIAYRKGSPRDDIRSAIVTRLVAQMRGDVRHSIK